VEDFEDIQQQIDFLAKQLQQTQLQLSQLSERLNAAKAINNVEEKNATKSEINSDVSSTAKRRTVSLKEHSALENFIGLKIINLVGIIVLLIGISIGVKYAIDKNLITPFARIVLAYAAGAGLFILSLILRKNYEGFSAILFSGAMASAYFTTYGAFAYYNLFSQALCFIIIAVIAIYTAIQSLKYDRQIIAIPGMVGAYAIPLLISSNHEDYVLLFSYILVMNIGILFISFKRSWRTLNLLALIITWSFFNGWLFLKYHNADKFYALLFMVVYYILFLLIDFGFSIMKKMRVNNQQLLNVLINDCALYIALIAIYDAASSDAVASTVTGICAILFLAMAVAGNKFFREEEMLNRIHYTEALVLIILFVSLKWSGLTITLLWTLIAVIVFALGIAAKRIWPRLAAIILIGLTLLKLIVLDSMSFTAIQKIIAYITLGTLLLVLSFFYQKFKQVLFNDNE
jgi:uncharacterized membrane protein